MRRLNLATEIIIPGDATEGNISYVGLTSPTVTEIGDNPDVTVAADGAFLLASELLDTTERVTVKVQDALGYFIQGPVDIIGDGASVQRMPIGMNLASPSTYSGAYPFANMAHGMGLWDRTSGSSAFTQSFGTLTPTNPADIFRAYLSDNGTGWLDGTYHVNNPDGCEIAFGTFGNPTAYSGWTTSTSFDVVLNASGGQVIALYCRGGLTNAGGPFQIMRPGHGSTEKWNQDLLAFYAGLGPVELIRAMDFVSASDNVETLWSQRVPASAICFRSPCAYGKPCVPYEFIFDLCNTLDVDCWLNIPVRANAAHKMALAALGASTLSSHLKVWPECGNETWNSGNAWKECKAWQDYYSNTKLTATANYGANTFTLVAHGLVTGDDVRCFDTPENLALALNQPYPYPGVVTGLTESNIAYVERVDADTFKLYSNVGRTTLLTVAAKQTNQIVMNNIYPSAATVYGDMMIETWDIFDAAFGVDRVVHFIPSQAGSYNAAVTTSRFSNTAAAARAEAVAVAPYFNGNYWAARIVTASGSFSPEVWVSASTSPFVFALYAAGAAPATVDEVLEGTGAIALQISSTAYVQANFWRRESAGLALVSGLTDGVSYDCVFIFEGKYMAKSTVVASASVTKNYIYDSAANQAERMILNAYYTSPTVAPYDHFTASGGKEVICYEAGADFNGNWPYDGASPDMHIDDWRKVIQETPEYADGIFKALYIRASQNLSHLAYFADTGTGSFSMAEDYADVTDERYLAIASMAGSARVYAPPVVEDATAARITALPGSLPYVVYTFPDATLNYQIIAGNTSGNFDISGNTLRLVADNGIVWPSSTTYPIRIMADNGYTIDLATISVTAGATVFEPQTDALIARMTPAPDATHKLQINDVFVALNGGSVTDKLEGFYINCDPSASQIVENWVSTDWDQTNVGGTFTADSGVAGDATSAYLSTQFLPGASTKFQRDSAHLWACSLTATGSPAGYEVGSETAQIWTLSTGRSDQGDAPRGGINAAFVNYPVQADCKGVYILSRTDANLTTMYKNGTSIGTDATPSSAPYPSKFTALRYNTIYSGKELAGWGWGSGLTDADAAVLSDAVTAYVVARRGSI